jgi:hypothetical protein
MRKALLLQLFFVASFCSYGQVKMDDFGRIILNTYIPEKLDIPEEAKSALKNKLNQITSSTGIGGSSSNPRFIITANVNVGTKDIIPGPPQMIALNIDVTLFIGDVTTNTIFSNVVLSLKGVGTNENKALIEAFKPINAKRPDVLEFIETGKNKIIDYYSSQCEQTIKEAESLLAQEKFDAAILKLAQVPEMCESCYYQSLDATATIYQKKIDKEGTQKLNSAKMLWAGEQTPAGAEKVADILKTIPSRALCIPEVEKLMTDIQQKIKADEKAKWDFEMKKYQDKIAMEKENLRIAEEKSIRDDQHREAQAQRNAQFTENQAQRDAQFKENQAQRDASHAENEAKRDAQYRESQAQRDFQASESAAKRYASQSEAAAKRNYELDKLNAQAYREVAAAYANTLSTAVLYSDIYWR